MESAKPYDDPGFSNDEQYMNAEQLAYFKNKLILKKTELMDRTNKIKSKLKLFASAHSDIVDKSNALIELEHDIKAQERNTIQIRQIDAALKRIEDGSFGYCEITGQEIGLKRLEALPFTNLSVNALEEAEETWQ